MKNLRKRFDRICSFLFPPTRDSYLYLREANDLVVDLANSGEGAMADFLANQVYFLSDYQAKSHGSPEERFRGCLRGE